jgi:hypothetical protein
MPNRSLVPRSFLAVVAVLCGLAFSAAPALADADGTDNVPDQAVSQTTGASAQECRDPLIVHPFTPWGDLRDYVLVPGGDFSDPSSGWQLTGGATIVNATQSDGTAGGVLDLPGGAVAVSPTVCVDINYPTARVQSRTLRGRGGVAVAVAYQDTKTQFRPRLVDVVTNRGSGWALSRDIQIRPQIAGRESGWRRVAFVFAAGGTRSSEFQIDDLHVDPRMSR